MAEQQQQPSNQPRITVDGRPLPDEVARALITAVVDDSLRLPDLFRLTFRDPGRSVLAAAGFKIGAAVEIVMISEAAPGGEPLLKGEVTALEAEVDPGGTRTTVRGYDKSHRLFRGRITESYTNVTYADVARRVAQRAGLEAGQIDQTQTVQPHVSQGNLTDWRFLELMAEEVGFEVAVRDGKLDFRRPVEAGTGPADGALDTQDPLQLVLGSNLLRLRAAVTAAEQVKQVDVRGWDPTAKRALVGSAPAATRSAELPVTPAGLAGTFGGPTFTGTDIPYRTQPEVDAAARSIADQIAGAFAELDGAARGNPRLRAGAAVSLSLVGEPFDGKYILSATRHVYDPEAGYTTDFTVSGRQERSLHGLARGAANGSGHLPGVFPAQVTDVRDPEGRVKLKFPWLSDKYVSDWTRTVQPGAGSKRGAVVLPEVNDEVLVAFEQGDLRRPYVLGGLYNGVDKALLGDKLVDGSTGAVRRRGFVSKKGHLLVFFDDDADQGVAIITGDKGMRVALNTTKKTVRIVSSGKVEVEASTDVKVKAGGSCSVEATGSLTLKGASVKLEASGAVEVSGKPIKLN